MSRTNRIGFWMYSPEMIEYKDYEYKDDEDEKYEDAYEDGDEYDEDGDDYENGEEHYEYDKPIHEFKLSSPIRKAIMADSRSSFVSELLLKNNRSFISELPQGDMRYEEFLEFFAFEMEIIISRGKVKCASALLEEEAEALGMSSSVDLNIPLTKKKPQYPIHMAASEYQFGIVDLFLRHGARTDLSSSKCGKAKNCLPINAALEMLNEDKYFIDWNYLEEEEVSIYKLITILCLPRFKIKLETIRLLAWNTKDVKQVFCHYVMNSKFIQMAALLMTSMHLVMPDYAFFRRFIEENICLLDNLEMKSLSLTSVSGNANKRSINSELVQSCKDKRMALTYVLAFIELFDVVGDAIGSYLRLGQQNEDFPREMVVKDIVGIFVEAGFALKYEDIDFSKIDRAIFEQYESGIHFLKDDDRELLLPDLVDWHSWKEFEALRSKAINVLPSKLPTTKFSNKHMKVVNFPKVSTNCFFRNYNNGTQQPLLRFKPSSLLASCLSSKVNTYLRNFNGQAFFQ